MAGVGGADDVVLENKPRGATRLHVRFLILHHTVISCAVPVVPWSVLVVACLPPSFLSPSERKQLTLRRVRFRTLVRGVCLFASSSVVLVCSQRHCAAAVNATGIAGCGRPQRGAGECTVDYTHTNVVQVSAQLMSAHQHDFPNVVAERTARSRVVSVVPWFTPCLALCVVPCSCRCVVLFSLVSLSVLLWFPAHPSFHCRSAGVTAAVARVGASLGSPHKVDETLSSQPHPL